MKATSQSSTPSPQKPRLHQQRGQVLIEAVLLLSLVVGMWGLFSKFARDKKWIENLVSGPWESMSGMIESGVWETPATARKKHPNHFYRAVSLREDP